MAQRSRYTARAAQAWGIRSNALARLGDYYLWKGDGEHAETLIEQSLALAEEVRYTSESSRAGRERSLAATRAVSTKPKKRACSHSTCCAPPG